MTLLTDDGKLGLGWRIVVGILLVLAANYLAAAIANAAANSQRSFEVVYRPTLLILLVAWFSAMLLFADRISGNPLQELGLGRAHAVSDSLLGMAIGAACIFVGIAVMAVWGRLSFSARLNGHTAMLLLIEIFILSTAAMAEEVMFRGYPFQRILEGAGPVVAIVVLSVFFGIAHHWNPHARDVAALSLFNTVFVGVLLSLAYLRVRNLWLPWGIHFAWNSMLGVVFGLPVSGLNDFSVIIRGRAAGPVWLTGGAYGIEGSLAGTLAILAGFVPLYWFTRNRVTMGVAAKGPDTSQPDGRPEQQPHPSNG